MNEHPSEADLQQFASGQSENNPEIKLHISSCDECNATVAVYRLLFSTIEQQEKPGFDFDLSGLVLQKIPATQSIHSQDSNLILYIIGFAAICLQAAALYWYKEVLYGIFSNFDSLFIVLVATTAFLTVLFLLADIYNSYQQKLKALDFY